MNKVFLMRTLSQLGERGPYYFQFNSIYFPSKQQTHLKNTQDGGDATESKSLKNVAPLYN